MIRWSGLGQFAVFDERCGYPCIPLVMKTLSRGWLLLSELMYQLSLPLRKVDAEDAEESGKQEVYQVWYSFAQPPVLDMLVLDMLAMLPLPHIDSQDLDMDMPMTIDTTTASVRLMLTLMIALLGSPVVQSDQASKNQWAQWQRSQTVWQPIYVDNMYIVLYLCLLMHLFELKC